MGKAWERRGCCVWLRSGRERTIGVGLMSAQRSRTTRETERCGWKRLVSGLVSSAVTISSKMRRRADWRPMRSCHEPSFRLCKSGQHGFAPSIWCLPTSRQECAWNAPANSAGHMHSGFRADGFPHDTLNHCRLTPCIRLDSSQLPRHAQRLSQMLVEVGAQLEDDDGVVREGDAEDLA